jgi:hypothetical protein
VESHLHNLGGVTVIKDRLIEVAVALSMLTVAMTALAAFMR